MNYVDMPTLCILQVHSAHTHTHIFIPFEDGHEPTGLKVDVPDDDCFKKRSFYIALFSALEQAHCPHM